MIDLMWLPGVLVLLFMTMPLWARVVNEITARTVGRAIVICPHCGTPGVVRSSSPRVFR